VKLKLAPRLAASLKHLEKAAAADQSRQAHRRDLKVVFDVVLDALLDLNGSARAASPPKFKG
jgi:hypothetical protein